MTGGPFFRHSNPVDEQTRTAGPQQIDGGLGESGIRRGHAVHRARERPSYRDVHDQVQVSYSSDPISVIVGAQASEARTLEKLSAIAGGAR